MGRRTKEITIPQGDSRDAGRKYLLTEMPAAQAEKWAMRVLNGLAVAKVDIGSVEPLMGMAGVAQAVASLGVLAIDAIARMPWELAEPLLDEMMGCVQIVPASGVRALNEAAGDIEEVSTRILLRGEVLSLHVGFSIPERVSTLISQLRTRPDTSPSTTPTSPEASE